MLPGRADRYGHGAVRLLEHDQHRAALRSDGDRTIARAGMREAHVAGVERHLAHGLLALDDVFAIVRGVRMHVDLRAGLELGENDQRRGTILLVHEKAGVLYAVVAARPPADLGSEDVPVS